MKRRSLLFVPGNNKRMIIKSLSEEIHADCVILDLEDAVPPYEKELAREIISGVLNGVLTRPKNKQIYVRINQITSEYFDNDIKFLKKQDKVDCVVLPKAEGDISVIQKETGMTVIPIIESALGIIRIQEVARSDGVVALTYGTADFALSMGGSFKYYDKDPFLPMSVVTIAKAYGLDPIDKVCFEISNLSSLRNEATNAKAMGFSGKLVIHPTQVDPVNEIFTPSKKEIEWAEKVVKVYEQMMNRGRGAINLDGTLIDMVHYKLAKKILDSI
ncbi:MAG: CoA ester lyase [Conexivisphaerales archaeon]